jgi:putative transposase
VVDPTMEPVAWLRKQLEDGNEDLLREMVRVFAETVMSGEADELCGAAYGERSDARVNRRNGYRMRTWDTRTGTISLALPKLREGSYCDDRGVAGAAQA